MVLRLNQKLALIECSGMIFEGLLLKEQFEAVKSAFLTRNQREAAKS